jgi:hypothetical protein
MKWPQLFTKFACRGRYKNRILDSRQAVVPGRPSGQCPLGEMDRRVQLKLIVNGILWRFFGFGFVELRVENQNAKKIDPMHAGPVGGTRQYGGNIPLAWVRS